MRFHQSRVRVENAKKKKILNIKPFWPPIESTLLNFNAFCVIILLCVKVEFVVCLRLLLDYRALLRLITLGFRFVRFFIDRYFLLAKKKKKKNVNGKPYNWIGGRFDYFTRSWKIPLKVTRRLYDVPGFTGYADEVNLMAHYNAFGAFLFLAHRNIKPSYARV